MEKYDYEKTESGTLKNKSFSHVGTLDSVAAGDTVRVISVNSPQPIRRRLLDLGFLEGVPVTPVMKSPLGDPSAYLVRGTVIALRFEDARTVTVGHEN